MIRLIATLSVICFLRIICAAQSIPEGSFFIKTNDLYPERFGIEISANKGDKTTGYRILTPDGVNDNSYNVRDYYLNGKLKFAGTSKSPNPDLKLDGLCKGFYENGQVKFEEYFTNNVCDGGIIRYYPDGKVYMTGEYDKQGILFVNECADSIGTKLAENGKGKCAIYDESMKTIIAQGSIQNRTKEGEWTGVIGEFGKYSCVFKNGKLVSGTAIDKSGTSKRFKEEFSVAEYKEGSKQLALFIGGRLKTPADIIEKLGALRRVFVTFIVNEDGTLTDLKMLNGVAKEVDDEVIRVLFLSSGKWKPAYKFGVPVKSLCTLPVAL